MLMHTFKKRLKEIDEHYEVKKDGDIYFIRYKERFHTNTLISFEENKVKFYEPILNAMANESYFPPEALPDLWKIIKLISEYLNLREV